MSLKYLAAYALASLTNPKPTKDDVKKIVTASGAKVAAEDLDFVFEQIGGKDVNTLIAEGMKLQAASAPAGGGGAPAAGGAAPAAAAGGKKEAKKEEPEEEEDDMFGGGLFD